MKINILICLIAFVFGISSCDDNDEKKIFYPVTADLGERTCTGDIAWLPLPPTSSEEPPLPGMTLCLKTGSGDYYLTCKGQWSVETITLGDVTYTLDAGDRVEIAGTVKRTRISASKAYYELEIKSLKRILVTADLGERTCTGKLVALPNPPDGSDEPIVPGTVMGLETDTEKYLLTFGGKWAWEESATVGGVVYTLGERVEITGTAKRTKISASEEYLELEAGKIEKLE